ncbi:peptide deformylase [Lichenihabitans sp. PAMC28606]|uniref:peptide deformylase n=1 Tax=Lichenihabitans sp. PAMC28606 TaxID=2880932 RepID=UPI0039B47613
MPQVTEATRTLLHDMLETMHDAQGRGLAAVQIDAAFGTGIGIGAGPTAGGVTPAPPDRFPARDPASAAASGAAKWAISGQNCCSARPRTHCDSTTATSRAPP